MRAIPIGRKWELVRRAGPFNWDHAALVLAVLLMGASPASMVGVPALVLLTLLLAGGRRLER